MKKLLKTRLAAGALALVMAWSLLPAAGAEDQPADPPSEPPAPVSIGFDPDLSKNPDPELIDTVVLSPEEAEEIKAVVDPSDAVYEAIKWTVSDPQVVELTAAGDKKETASLRGLKPGSAEVTATAGEASGKFKVQVSGLTLEPKREMLVGRDETLTLGVFGTARKQDIRWESSNISVAEVQQGRVTAFNPGVTVITASAGTYRVRCEVTVREDTAADLNTSMEVGQVLSFGPLVSQLEESFSQDPLIHLEYLTGVSVSTRQGLLCYGYSTPDMPGQGVGGSEKFYVNPGSGQKRLSDITFVPAADFGGEAVISYTGYGGGQSRNGRIRIQVENSGDVAYHTANTRPVPFGAEDFVGVCKNKTGKTLRSVRFRLPPASQGTLYYQYSTTGQYSQRVTDTEDYRVAGGSTLLENVSFLPAKGFTGTVRIPYTGTTDAGSSYSGQVTIQVTAEDRPGDPGAISLTCPAGGSVRLDGDDFQKASLDAVNSSLDYIYLTQPSTGDGKFYVNYTSKDRYDAVASETQRYSHSRINDLSFVAAEGASGTVTVPYTGYSVSGEQFRGELLIRISGGSGSLHYSAAAGQRVAFSSRDFNEVCQSANGRSLRSVKFTLPASWEGTLYLNYRSSTSRGTELSSNSWYDASRLSDVSFVPAAGFSGTVTIPFTGEDDRGERFSGQVVIDVDSQGLGDQIAYTVRSGQAVSFRSDDFDRACRRLTGDGLDSVRFTPPSSRSGKLYERYDRDRDNGTTVSSGRSYYRSQSPWIDDVTFTADRDVSGLVEIPYTGRSTGGRSFDGTVLISVSSGTAQPVRYYGSSLPLKLDAASFRSACASQLPGDLNYITFPTLPASLYGQLKVDYVRPNTGTPALPDTRYYVNQPPLIDNLTFLPRAGFQGRVTLSFRAVDVRGNQTEGTLELNLSNQNILPHFTDLKGYEWATPSIEYLYQGGVVNGYSATTFGPAGNTSRGAFTLMICRLFHFPPQVGSGFRDVPAGSPYEAAVVTARQLGIVNGDNGFFHPEDPVTRQQAVVMLARAMEAAGWPVQSSSVSALSSYADGDQVSGYARSAMASMIRMGVVQGDQQGNLRPNQPITRAQMAVILHRVLTY